MLAVWLLIGREKPQWHFCEADQEQIESMNPYKLKKTKHIFIEIEKENLWLTCST